ncbi:hypothetical protein HOP50_11g61300 [Chloropicon primus]|uniref:Cystatin domain-containing protein n=1 Tax=Chloropicon primus TaxID=1764295 RepID=A0A5B8MT77_9CHLO|nr:hypothetical protein A3770_11p61090 [Chloropicon primus]UPR02803.1 hypothetical protein HOP50_11g61300 [Chloropicon primus]|eukprot:QDZ23591.1 hypothetical protein A3770_11p61090 [Chloropicon primus]
MGVGMAGVEASSTPGAIAAVGSLGSSIYGGRRALQQFPSQPALMPGPFLAGGWSEVSADQDFQTLVNVFNYATLVMPELNANAKSPGGTMELCEARSQVVAGMNYFLSLSPDCADPNVQPKNITVYQSLDGQYEITALAGF